MVNFVAKVIANGQECQGESIEPGFESWIEVVAFDWGGDRGSVGSSGARRAARVSYRPLILRKRVDAASPLLFKALDQNEQCEVTLQLRKTGTGGALENYFQIKLTGALILAIKQGNLQFGGESPEEEISFGYQTVEQIYDAQDKDTGITRGSITHMAMWNTTDT